MNFVLKVLSIMTVMTASMVLYVYGQSAIFQVSYSLNTKSEILRETNEQYRRLRYEVESLKAPGLLEARMRELELQLDLPREFRTIRVPSFSGRQDLPIPDTPAPSSIPGRFDLLGRLVNVAQAQMDH